MSTPTPTPGASSDESAGVSHGDQSSNAIVLANARSVGSRSNARREAARLAGRVDVKCEQRMAQWW
jgi:hypothetical protein